MKLGLGAVQFGCDYGISNKNGQVSLDEIIKILEYAKENGIDTIDTANLYGNSEEVLGQFNLDDFKVVTKTVKVDKNLNCHENIKYFKDAFFQSQKKLGNIRLHGLLFHESTDLLGDYSEHLWDLLSSFKNKEYVNKIGVSVYTPDILCKILEKFDIDIVQLPLNILDQRFVPLLGKLKEKNIEIHTRSTFLQGLLLMENDAISDYFNEIKSLIKMLPKPRLAYALQFVDSLGGGGGGLK